MKEKPRKGLFSLPNSQSRWVGDMVSLKDDLWLVRMPKVDVLTRKIGVNCCKLCLTDIGTDKGFLGRMMGYVSRQGSGYDRGHMAPAGDMPTPQAMAQNFSLANMVPQAPEHNRGVWARSVEAATRKYVSGATGDVYVITGPVFIPSIAASPSVGANEVRVPKYLFKLVYDQKLNRAWVYWQENDNSTRGSKPISYSELVKRTGAEYLPGVNPSN